MTELAEIMAPLGIKAKELKDKQQWFWRAGKVGKGKISYGINHEDRDNRFVWLTIGAPDQKGEITYRTTWSKKEGKVRQLLSNDSVLFDSRIPSLRGQRAQKTGAQIQSGVKYLLEKKSQNIQ